MKSLSLSCLLMMILKEKEKEMEMEMVWVKAAFVTCDSKIGEMSAGEHHSMIGLTEGRNRMRIYILFDNEMREEQKGDCLKGKREREGGR